ncbi:MAG TPA: transglycosylase domain-containing protein [Candidatus Saccharimonadales bacterium]|nr:transglycosylase domain-containing protein [Candidatus Saccharimonadales bacterium]
MNRSLSDRVKAARAARAAQRATYLSTLPKGRLKRWAYRMQPKHLAEYWFSREGGIMALKIIGVAIVVGFFLTIGLFAYFRKDLPKIKDISGDNLGGSITYYDRTGQTVLWQDYNAVKRIPVQSNDISPYMKDATVAIEDKDFYKHGAFDARGILRAATHDVFGGGGGTVQGGSTITQQLVKLNENWTTNRTITRKVKELILAVELEREYSKNDILTGYLNIAPYGGVEYGVESAAEDYFQTSAKNLTLPQAAMLAAIPQSPSYYSPYASSQFNSAVTDSTFSQSALLNRQHYILDQMATQGYITKQQAADAKKVNVLAQVHQQAPKYQGIKAPYFVLAAKQELEQTYGAATVQRGGWKVITTLDMNLQNKADELVQANVKNVSRYGADEEALVLEDVPTGQMMALVGGTDFNNPDHGQNNYAAGIQIPPGSSFKPYDYTTLINNNNNVGAGSVLYDTQQALPGYPCTNKTRPFNSAGNPTGGNCLWDYDFKYPGPLTLRYALGGSRNVPAVKSMLEAVPGDKSPYTKSVNKVISTASAMMDNTYDQSHKISPYNCYSDAALTKTTQCYGASAIGDGAYLHLDDHVNGLATLGRLGKAIPRTYILKITDASNKTVYQWKQPVGQQVVKQDSAYIVDNMASDPRASYLPGSCSATTCTSLAAGGYKFQRYDGWDFAVKTGTTNNGYDGLMTSWSTKYAVVSWVGNHTRNVELNTSMEYLTEPLTRAMMEYAHQGLKPDNWTQPKDIKTASAYVVRNHIDYGDQEPSPSTDLYPSWYVGGGATSKSTSATIDRVSGKLATSCTPAAAKEYVSNGNVASWNIDIFNGGIQNIGSGSSSSKSTSSSSASDDVHNCNDSPPTVTLTTPSSCNTSCTITATITQGTHPLSDPQYYTGTVTFTLGGRTIYSAHVSTSPSTISFPYTPSSSGSGTLTVTVTDSVLYSASQSVAFSYTVPAPAPTTPTTPTTPDQGTTGTGGTGQ